MLGCTQDSGWENKMEQTHLDGSALDTVFLRTNQAGAAVLHKLLANLISRLVLT